MKHLILVPLRGDKVVVYDFEEKKTQYCDFVINDYPMEDYMAEIINRDRIVFESDIVNLQTFLNVV